jgi:hypothetical protein
MQCARWSITSKVCIENKLEKRARRGGETMGLMVCPAAIIAAPIDTVWALLIDPIYIGEWADATTERVEPPRPTSPGQTIYLTSKEFRLKWRIMLNVAAISQEKHQFYTFVTFPLGMHLEEHISCTPIDATSCRVQYG